MVRVALENDAPPAGALAVTTPFGYSADPLARRASETSTLALPHVVTFFPCVTLPRLQDGAVEPPGLIITTRAADPLLLDPGTSPFRGLLDTYDLQRLPIDRSLQPRTGASSNRSTDITAYTIDARIRGWVKVQPVRT
jgi:hypothetical protein